MSKPTRPGGNQGRRSQNPTKKSKERIDATVAAANTVPAESVQTVPVPADTVPATAEIVSAPADAVSALAPFSATEDPVSTAAHTVRAAADIVSLPAPPAPRPAKTVAVLASTIAAPTNTAATPTNTLSRGIQTIAAAYGDYTKKSLEDTRCFVEKLARVRSLDKALEVQAEYAKAAYETFVAESQKIRGLYSDLATQTFKPFEGLTPKANRAAR
jgi:Phasin protein